MSRRNGLISTGKAPRNAHVQYRKSSANDRLQTSLSGGRSAAGSVRYSALRHPPPCQAGPFEGSAVTSFPLASPTATPWVGRRLRARQEAPN